MITPEDASFHTPDNVSYDWAETTFFSIYIPEDNLVAWVYSVARAGVNAMVCDVQAFNKISSMPLDSTYVDFQQHLPLPEKLEDYELPNGLKLKATKPPLDYRITYQGIDDTDFDWTVTSLMEPYDIHDPKMDPLASPDPMSTGFGAAYANHYDMTVHVDGRLKIRGREYPVDCVTTMDHSWGPRTERMMNYNCWVNANFDKKNALGMIWKWNPDAQGWDQFELAHGYFLKDGKVCGLTQGRMRASRKGPWPTSYEAEVVDIEGEVHHLVGTVIAQQNWPCYSNTFVPFSSVRWYYRNSVGQGVAQECWPLDRLAGKGYGQ